MELQLREELWKKCVDFHGHECGGLLIGFRAALYAMELLELDYSQDEEVVCIIENDACGADAIQVVLGCSVGKGNLLFKLRGKQAFSFYNRKTEKGVRLVLKDTEGMESQEKRRYLEQQPGEALFDVKEAVDELPSKAWRLPSVKCEQCGEMTAENMVRLQNGRKLCLDCYVPYSRFLD